MRNILKISTILGILLLFMTSCGSDDVKSSPAITGIESMVQLMQGDSKSFELAGGDGRFSAMSENKQIATVEVNGKKITITGIAGGKTKITINAGSKVKVVEVTVEKKELLDITGVEEMVSVLQGKSKTFELSGGDDSFSAVSENSGVATVTVSGKKVTITGVAGGKTKVTITSGDKTKVIEIEIIGSKEGVYKDGESKAIFKATVSGMKGLWLLEKTGNPYGGKRLFLPLFRDLEKGQKLNVEVKSFGIDDISTKVQMIDVVDVFDSVVVLKFENGTTLVIPKM